MADCLRLRIAVEYPIIIIIIMCAISYALCLYRIIIIDSLTKYYYWNNVTWTEQWTVTWASCKLLVEYRIFETIIRYWARVAAFWLISPKIWRFARKNDLCSTHPSFVFDDLSLISDWFTSRWLGTISHETEYFFGLK